MAEVIVTEEAERCLHEIYAYIAQDNKEAASKLIDGIYARLETLRDYPEIGYRYERARSRHVRILLYGHYRIAYAIKSDSNIDVIGIYHGARLIDRFLDDA